MNKTIVFDLDDTLYKEIEYLKSAYNFICNYLNLDIYEEMMNLYFQEKDVFDIIIKRYNLCTNKSTFVNLYRNHFPNISLDVETREMITYLKCEGYSLGIITDGRSTTQRNKIEALEINKLFDLIIISEEIGSEKPNINNFLPFHDFNSESYFYIGDNINKDFYAPNKLNWLTVQLLDNGLNIKRKTIFLGELYNPKFQIKSLRELKKILNAK
jgi:putative hydrolase of the HAD superfamily